MQPSGGTNTSVNLKGDVYCPSTSSPLARPQAEVHMDIRYYKTTNSYIPIFAKINFVLFCLVFFRFFREGCVRFYSPLFQGVTGVTGAKSS